LVAGARSLRSVLGTLTWQESSLLMLQVAEGLAAAHAQGVIHRDIKPDNLLLSADGVVKLADFGLATGTDVSAITAEGAQVGTPRYMAPELLRGYSGTPQSDVYAFGCNWYHAIVGEPPFQGSTAAVLMQHLDAEAPDPRTRIKDVPTPVADLIHRCLDKDPAKRPATGGALAEELRQTLQNVGAIGETTSATRRRSTTALIPQSVEPGTAGDTIIGEEPTRYLPQSLTTPTQAVNIEKTPVSVIVKESWTVRWRRKVAWLLGVGAVATVLVLYGQFAPRRSWAFPARPVWAGDFGRDSRGIWADLALDARTIRFRYLAPGSFRMGDPPDLGGIPDAEMQHTVALTKGFWLAETELTQAQWALVESQNPSQFMGGERPVERVSWDDAQAFFQRFAARVPGFMPRLPTEAEWEYACRAGSELPPHAIEAVQRGLMATAQSMAQKVDAVAHGALVASAERDPLLVDKAVFARQLGKLEAERAVHPELKFIYTAARWSVGSATAVRFVLDPTPPGDADRDGIEDRSALGDVFPRPAPELIAALDRGLPGIEKAFTQDRWGVLMSAYAPIQTADGRVTGVLGCDLEPAEFRQKLGQLALSGLIEVGWFKENSPDGTRPVGQKPANAWGLYDMQGNVAEWCADGYAPYGAGSVTDPFVAEGSMRVFRGGSWRFPAENGRSGQRSRDQQDIAESYRGLRLAVDAEPGW
jgi:formylglycine-generating enzyme required for sulfatase activity